MFNPNHPNHRNSPHHPNRGGFTLAEMMIATVILLFLITTASAIATNFFNSLRNIQAANTVYDEANFTMERIIKEIRSGTVDYEEYYNQSNNFQGLETNETYGQNYCQYSRQFYGPGPDGKYGTFDDESTGIRKAGSLVPIDAPIQKKLYLIDTSGTQRTYVQRVEIQKMDFSKDPPTPIGKPIGKVAILKLDGKDYGINHWVDSGGKPECKDSGEGDGLIDTWVCASGFKCAEKATQFTTLSGGQCDGILETPFDTPKHLNDVVTDLDAVNTEVSSFVDITPETIDVVSLDFIITPSDDPRKAYNQADIQIQPNATLKMVTRAAPRIASTFKGNTPTIVLESTVSARAAKEIITECNLQECIADMSKPCPKHTGILADLLQYCSQGVWPGCSETDYENYSLNHLTNNGDLALAEDRVRALGIRGSESDGSLTPHEMAGIVSDGMDHVGPFENSPRTFYETTGSEMGSCVKPGPNDSTIPDDACRSRRCTDGVDNDVNDKKDNEDPACLYYLCNNGYPDPGEICTDIGGICQFMPQHELVNRGTETNCTDNYDNDCNYNFDLKWDDIDNNSSSSSQIITAEQKALAEFRGAGLNSSVAELNIALGQGADEYDQNCIERLCDNDTKDVGNFGPKDYEMPWYLFGKLKSDELDEKCVDIGGLCDWTTNRLHRKTDREYEKGRVIAADEPERSLDMLIQSGNLCYDGLDNDCDYALGSTPDPISDPDNSTGADEFDGDCKPAICNNKSSDQELASIPMNNSSYSYDYLVNYQDTLAALGQNTDLDETCADIGGLCGGSGGSGELMLENSNLNCVQVCDPASPQCVRDCKCFDGIDNDCGGGGPEGNGIDGVIDTDISIFTSGASKKMADENCCPDGDADGFAPFIAKSCNPTGALDSDTGKGYIDCNDDPNTGGTNIYPDAPELCGDGIDSNCSLANGIDNGTDNVEPTCCIDTDGDGFGLQDANLPNTSVDPKCMGSTSLLIDFTERTLYDCRDMVEVNGVNSSSINPGMPENTKALCTDGVNNSCRFVKEGAVLNPLKPRMDHIDMYATDAASLLAAWTEGKYNPDCCLSTTVGLADFYGTNSAASLHPGMEICDDTGSLLGNSLGSDENCNGLEGYDDDNCLGKDEMSFFDNLSTSKYITNGTPPVKIDFSVGTDGQRGRIQLETSADPSQSPTLGDVSSKTLPLASTCNRVATVKLTHNASLPDGIIYKVTNNGGGVGDADWFLMSEGETVSFTSDGKDLRWKATLMRSAPTDESPTLNDVTLTWACN